MKSVKWEKCWSGSRPVRLTFHNLLLCSYGFPWTPSIAVWRVFWPSMHTMWQLEERITDPASLRAGCRKVFLLHSDVYFSPVLHFSVVLYLFNFVVNMDYRSPVFESVGDHCVLCTGEESGLYQARNWQPPGIILAGEEVGGVRCSVPVWAWTKRSWSGRCRPSRPSRTSTPVSLWPAWLSSLPPLLSSWPHPASPLGLAGLSVACKSGSIREAIQY